MLMTVLKGELATQQSIALVRMFKQMRQYISEHELLSEQSITWTNREITRYWQKTVQTNIHSVLQQTRNLQSMPNTEAGTYSCFVYTAMNQELHPTLVG